MGVCEVPEVRESVEDSPANPETEEDEEVDVVTDVHSELSTEDKVCTATSVIFLCLVTAW